MKVRRCLWTLALAGVMACTRGVAADMQEETTRGRVLYSPQRGAIGVFDFPETAPATPQTLLEANNREGWGKIFYDEGTDTYTIRTDLWIGTDQDLGTYLQIGDADHPRASVVVRGTVWVRPPRESLRRPDGRLAIMNRLRLGVPDDPSIRPSLRFDCETPGEHGLYVGYRPAKFSDWGKDVQSRGGLHLYHATVTALRQDPEHTWGTDAYRTEDARYPWSAPGWYGSDIRVIDSTVSWFKDTPCYAAQAHNSTIRGSTFAHGDRPFKNGRYLFEGCTFRDQETPCLGTSIRYINCTFENNRYNWRGGGVTFLDCTLGEQEQPIDLRKRKLTAAQVRRGADTYPSTRMRRSLVVRVVDEIGQPVPDAMVVVSCDDAPDQVTRGAALTDADGRTPSDPQGEAIVVTERKWQATDDPDAPRESTYTYEVTVAAVGLAEKTASFTTERGVPRPFVVVLGQE